MDSLLSNAQRCARKADSLVVYGLYDEALNQLDKSIAYLNELKSLTTRYDNVQMLNVQIDSIDRKKRSVAIKRSESIKKKNRIDSFVQSKKQTNSSSNNTSNKTNNQYDLIEYTPVVNTRDENYYRKASNASEVSTLYVNGSKLDKNEKLIIEELSTTNAEFKKVNSFLVNEIEQLKRENDFLKVELIKLHMNDSLTSDSSISDPNHDLNSTTSNATNENSYSSTSSNTSSNLSVCNSVRSSPSTQIPHSVLQSKCSNINSEINDYKTPIRLLNNNINNTINRHSTSSATSSASSSSWSISSSSTSLSSHKTSHLKNSLSNTNKITENKSTKIDLSRYINDDDDDVDDINDGYEENDYDSFIKNNNNNNENRVVQDTDDEFDLNNSNMLPPNEFTF